MIVPVGGEAVKTGKSLSSSIHAVQDHMQASGEILSRKLTNSAGGSNGGLAISELRWEKSELALSGYEMVESDRPWCIGWDRNHYHSGSKGDLICESWWNEKREYVVGEA